MWDSSHTHTHHTINQIGSPHFKLSKTSLNNYFKHMDPKKKTHTHTHTTSLTDFIFQKTSQDSLVSIH